MAENLADSVSIGSWGEVVVTGSVTPLGLATFGILQPGEEGTSGVMVDPLSGARRDVLEEALLLQDASFAGGDLNIGIDGDLVPIVGLANLRDALGRRLLTRPGALFHHPDYGIGVQEFLNLPATLPNKMTLENRARRNFKQDTRVEAIVRTRVRQEQDGLIVLTSVIRAIGVEAEFIFEARRA